MKYFGTVKSFDDDKGLGLLKPETGGDDLRFERNAMSWDEPRTATVGDRLSYDKGMHDNRPCAMNLAKI